MDYCSTCRRHLNGALVCPGCGAYAPDIAPLPGGAPAPIASSTAAQVQHAFPAETPPDTSYDAGPAESAHDADIPYDAAATPDGRAARRRQRERWRKTQRRALVATAVALVGGGLTVASMNRQTPARTQAASAPDRETMGIAEEEITQSTPGTTASDAQRATPGTTPGRSSAARGTAEGLGATGSGHSAPDVRTPDTVREQSAAQPQGAPANRQQAAPSSPTPSTGSQGTATTPGTSGAATAPTPAPSPSGGGTSGSGTSGSGSAGSGASGSGASAGSGSSGSGTSGSGTSGSGTAGSGTASDATDPAGLCLLGLVCIK
ncbi:hypothetical protein DF268_10930 [Streptomyces sp. V2]|uniref:SCO2400 family protein n=1 Tax=Streptomyces sp. V2 TaxID=1424099 RepID=UPI000D66F59B|nr:hypothetical protein [Streptomyces sp. V2]PWG13465.1 hypothetical protein DF268_10930 [Streptomyces sp. V2]